MYNKDVVDAAIRDGRTVTINTDGSATINPPSNGSSSGSSNSYNSGRPTHNQSTGRECNWKPDVSGNVVDVNDPSNSNYHGYHGH